MNKEMGYTELMPDDDFSYVDDYSQHGDINDYLAEILGPDFREYRRRWNDAHRLEVETEFPEAVNTSNFDVHDHETDEVVVEDVKTLDAHIINVYLVKAVQELKEELDAAKVRITELES